MEKLSTKMTRTLTSKALTFDHEETTAAARGESPRQPRDVLRVGPHKEDGVIKDISASGCLIASEVDVAIGDVIIVPIHAPGLLHMRVLGVVVRKVIQGGFAVRFVRPSVTERTLLSRFVEHVLKEHGSSVGVGG